MRYLDLRDMQLMLCNTSADAMLHVSILCNNIALKVVVKTKFYISIFPLQPNGLHLTARDPRWIGAWWLGYLILGSLILLSSFIVLGFPRVLPGAKETRQKHIEEGNIKKANSLQKPSLKRLLPELKSLLTNWTFLFNTLGITTTVLFFGSLAPFLPKVLQLKFGLKPEETGYVLGAMLIPTMSSRLIML